MISNLVTGANGVVGQRLVRLLQTGLDDKGWKNRTFRCDLGGTPQADYMPCDIREPGDVARLFHWSQPRIVYHLAAIYGRWVSDVQPFSALTTNVVGTANVADAAGVNCAERFVYISSSEAIDPVETWYGHTKRMAEDVARKFFGRRTLIVRPNMLYHQDEPAGMHRSVLVRFCMAIARGEAVEIHKDTSRNFLHIDDACRMLEHLANDGQAYPDPVYLCTTQAPISTERVAEIIADEMNLPLKVNRVTKPVGIKSTKRPQLHPGLERFLSWDQEIGIRAMAQSMKTRLA